MVFRGRAEKTRPQGARPNAVVVSVTDWLAAIQQKSTGSGEYVGGSPFLAAAQTIWDCPLIVSVGLPAGVAIVCDTRLLGQVLVREGITAAVGFDQDDWSRNRCTLLVEGRWAVEWDIPAAAVLVHLTGS